MTFRSMDILKPKNLSFFLFFTPSLYTAKKMATQAQLFAETCARCVPFQPVVNSPNLMAPRKQDPLVAQFQHPIPMPTVCYQAATRCLRWNQDTSPRNNAPFDPNQIGQCLGGMIL